MSHIYSVVPASVILFFPGISMAKKVINLSDRKIQAISSQLHLLVFYMGAELLGPKLWSSHLNPNCGQVYPKYQMQVLQQQHMKLKAAH